MNSGALSCPTPLQITILETRTQVYDKVYVRDFMIYDSSVMAGQLMRMHKTHEILNREYTLIYFPLSISERVIKNIADNP